MPISRNLAASFLGNTWTALVQVAFVPAYLAILGAEAYGLIAVHAVLQAMLSFLDLGLTPTLGREMARFSAGIRPAREIRDLLRSVELILLGLGLLVIAFMLVVSPWLARSWLTVDALPLETTVRALQLMGLLIALRWLVGLHRGAIAGFQHLVWLNAVGATFATLRGAGVVPVLAWVSPTIEAFFLYQAGVTLLEVVVHARKAWSLVPGIERPGFSPALLRGVGRFSGGMAVVALLYLVLSQTDKVLLSAMLPLADFGYYALASSVAAALNLLIAPIGGVAYPRFNQLAAGGEPRESIAAFHGFSQMVTIAIAPAAAVLALFAEPILASWTRDPAVSAAAAPLLGLLSIGAMLNAFMSMPYMVPLANGRVRPLIVINAAFVVAFVPAIYAGVSAYGAIASAYAWIAINASGVLLALPLLRAHMPPADRWRWLAGDVATPAIAALAGAALVHWAASPALAQGQGLSAVAVAYLAALSAAVLASSQGRQWLFTAAARSSRTPV